MFGLTQLGIVHTAISLVAVVAGCDCAHPRQENIFQKHGG